MAFMRSFSIWVFSFGSNYAFVRYVIRYWQTFLVKTNFAVLLKAHPFKLLGNFFAILGMSGYKNWSDLSFLPGILVSYVVFVICLVYIMSVKIWPCSLWVEIFVNLGIYFLVWPAFCHGNFGKFYLKPNLYYINIWNTITLLCKLWGKKMVKMGIFSLVPRVIPPVISQLTTVFLMHIIWFTNWSSQTFCKKWVE